MLVLGVHSKDRTSTKDKANIRNPKVNKGCPPLTGNLTSGDGVQISLGPQIQYIPLKVYGTGGFNAIHCWRYRADRASDKDVKTYKDSGRRHRRIATVYSWQTGKPYCNIESLYNMVNIFKTIPPKYFFFTHSWEWGMVCLFDGCKLCDRWFLCVCSCGSLCDIML